MASRPLLATAVLTALVHLDQWVQLLPAGTFRARDGRPTDAPHWQLDAAAASDLIARWQARTTPLVIDYEHQTLHAPQNGQPAPAAGWVRELAWRPAEGLFARVEWTERARAHIAAGEYRYLSPVFRYADDGTVIELYPSALTNNPGLDGMAAVALAALAARPLAPPTPKESPMTLLEQLLARLGLPQDTTETAALGAVAALKAQADASGAKIAALTGELADARALNAPAAEAMRAMQGQIAELTARLHADDVAREIEAGIAAGKLVPAQRAWAEALGKKDLASLREHIASAPQVVALGAQQTGGLPPGGADGKTLTAEQLAVCTAMGLTPEQFIAAAKP